MELTTPSSYIPNNLLIKKLILLFAIVILIPSMFLSANDKYITYTQSFPWIGPEGENPEVVFADLIEQERLIAVYSHDFHVFWFDPCNGWQNDGGKIRNDCEYKIKILRDVPNNHKEHVVQVPPNRDPTTIIVDINGTGNYTTIQEGINNSINGDTVLVYPGTYYENINYDGKNITVASLYINTQADSFIHQTVIDGNQNGSVVRVIDNEDNACICGFTIKNGSGTVYAYYYFFGGGLYIKNSDFLIEHCIIEDNTAHYGAGIECNNSNLDLVDTTIRYNHAFASSGGINFYQSTVNFSSINRCNIYENYAGSASDIGISYSPVMNIYVDTFTVMEPSSDFILGNEGSNVIEILNAKIGPINQDLYVSTSGDNSNSGLTIEEPLKTISYALLKVASDSTHHNTIHITDGIYSPSLTGEKFSLNCRNYVSLLGESEESTILDGENLASLITCHWFDDNCSIENITIKNGSARFGGGMYINDNSNPIFRNVTLKNNLADIGSSIYCSDNCNPIFKNVTIKGDLSVLLSSEPISIRDNSDPVFINCIIRGNVIDPDGTGAGAIGCVGHSNPILLNTKIVNNNDYYTSGIQSYNGSEDENPILINCTICDNSDCSHGIIYLLAHANITLINCNLRNYAEDEIFFSTSGDPDTVMISYSNIKDSINGINTNNNGTIIWGDGNIDEDPLFVGGDPFSYELSQYSPCIDAGTPDTTGLNLPATDLAGNQRIYNGRIDIGAYEYQGVGIDEPDTSFIHNLYLFNNTPNPFKESTTISFISADYERIKDYTLSIYNTKGQLVKRYEGNKENFWVRTEIVWDGTDEQGKQVSPGTFLYKLEYNGHAVVRKMVLLR